MRLKAANVVRTYLLSTSSSLSNYPSLKYTRAILDAIHSGDLAKVDYEIYETFNLSVPTSCTGVPSELLNPKKSWTEGEENFKEEVNKLGTLFVENFKKYQDEATEEVIKAGMFYNKDSLD